jgi:phosphoribosylformylglycinamidine (FGAM) synthase-like enzyme
VNVIAGSSGDQSKQFGLDENEWALLLDRLGRPPSELEGELFALLQGEEIAHRSSRSLLDSFIAEDLHLPTPPGVRVGTFKINDKVSLAVAVVHANRDLAVLPVYGCQSAISDALLRLSSLGARPLALVPLLRLGPLEEVSNQLVLQAVHAGASGTANAAGIPILDVDIYFHPRYQNSPLLNICAIGAIDHSFEQSEAPEPVSTAPKTVLYIGPSTNRENLPKLDKKGKPLEPKAGKVELVPRRSSELALRNLLDCISKMTDEKLLSAAAVCGVGGLAVCCRNLAVELGLGFKLDLDRVPGPRDLPIRDMLLSEGPERGLIAFPPDNHRRVLALLREYRISSVILGETDDLESLRLESNRKLLVDMPLVLLGQQRGKKNYNLVKFPPMLKVKKEVEQTQTKIKRTRSHEMNEWGEIREAAGTGAKPQVKSTLKQPKNLEDAWVDLLANPNIVSREPFQSELFNDQGGSNVLPFKAPASVLRLRRPGGSASPTDFAATVVTSASLYMAVDAYLGAVHSVAEGVRRLAAAGASPSGLCYSLNFGDPEDYREICDLSEAVRGIGDACKFWNIPIATETISLFNGSDSVPILPTPAIFLFGKIDTPQNSPGSAFRARKDRIFLIGSTKLEIECSEYAYYLHRYVGSKLPEIDFDHENVVNELIRGLASSGKLASAVPLSRGGLAIALSDSCMFRQPPIGASLTLVNTLGEETKRPDALLFSETSARFLVSCKPENEDAIIAACGERGVAITGMGEVGGKVIEVQDAVECQIPLSTAFRVWSNGLNYYLGLGSEDETMAG